MSHAALLCLALLLDALLGEPDWAWNRVPHPVVLMGRAIALADRTLNRGSLRRLRGALALVLLLIPCLALGLALAALPDFGVIEGLGAAILLAQRSLSDHVRTVTTALGESIGAGRTAVARIVGRDTEALDESGVARAAIESAAENFSDGLVAPAFWFLLFGLPGILIYKLVNTADSMIGHLDERYGEFGWAAAKLDDVLNWVPARISGALICLVAPNRRHAFSTMFEDWDLHASPNAGWPEAAMAGALDIALAGPRSYDGEATDDPWMNPDARRDLTATDITRAMTLTWRAWAVLLVAVGGPVLVLLAM